jgi:hypothetical protein
MKQKKLPVLRDLKKLRRAKGGAKIFGVFRVKNHDFTPKNHIFSIAEGVENMIFWRKIVIFHTKYPKNFRASLCSAQFF